MITSCLLMWCLHDEAIDWVNCHNASLEAIVTKDLEHAERFQDEVDAAAVYVNASTRLQMDLSLVWEQKLKFHQKMHARGPMGLEH